MIYNHKREKNFAFYFNHPPHRMNSLFLDTWIERSGPWKLDKYVLQKPRESSSIVSVSFIIDCIAGVLISRLCCILGKEFQHNEKDELSVEIETENYATTTIVV